MAQVTIDTVAYPAWWSAATTIRVTVQLAGSGGFAFDIDRSDAEMLPQGLSWEPGTLYPWEHVISIEKLT